MELKDGKIVISEEEKKLMGSDEWKAFAKENKLIVEKKVEIEKPLNDDLVSEYIDKSKGLSDKLYNKHTLKFLKAKLGKEVTEQDLGKDILLKDELNNFKSRAIKTAVSIGLNAIAPKHSKLLINAVDYNKLDFKDNQLVGFDDELNNLKTTYPDLFSVKGSTTPPAFPENKGNTKTTYEDFKKMTSSDKAKLSDDELKELIKGE